MAISTRHSRRPSCARRQRKLLVERLETRQLLTLLTEEFSAAATDYSSSEIIVRYKPSEPGNAVTNMMTGLATSQSYPFVPGLEVVPLTADITVDEMLAAYRTRMDVLYAEPNYRLQVDSIPNDARFEELWGLHNTGQSGGKIDADIDAPEAWQITTGDREIVVAVIDTGVDYTHPDLANNMWTNPGEIPGNRIDDDENGFVDDVHGYDFLQDDGDPSDSGRHGTHVSGTIAGLGNNGQGVAGVNWNVKIMAVKFLGVFGGTTANAIASVNYVTMMRQRGVNVKLSSNSWGGGAFSQALQDAIAASGEAGILFVAAAGNDGRNTDAAPKFPAAYPLDNIISVAASDRADAKASFSNWGENSVDLAAPGVQILSSTPGNSYTLASGTSMATPHVSGVAALAWSLAPNATYQEVRDAIFAGVDPNSDFRVDGPTPVATGGRLNAARTLQFMALTVTGSTPSANSYVEAPPTDYVIDFNSAVDAATLQASDFTVDGKPADAVLLSADRTTTTFTFAGSPVTAEGPHTMHIAADAIVNSGNSPLANNEFTGTFYFDTRATQVDSTTPQAGGGFKLPGPVAYDVTFNEPIDPASLQVGDLVLAGVPGAQVTDVIGVNDNRTARFTLSGMTAEGQLTATLLAGAIKDAFGSPNPTPFSATYVFDGDTIPLPGTPRAVLPLGSLIYDQAVSSIIGPAGDSDSFTLPLGSGQTLTLLVTPTSSSLQPIVEVRDPAGALLTADAALAVGGKAAIQTLAAADSGIYTITVSGANGTIGSYNLFAALNAAFDSEELNDGTNDTLATAQDLDATSIDLVPGSRISRLAVVGSIDAGPSRPRIDFETGALPPSVTTYSSKSYGRIRVMATGGTGNGSQFALVMDSSQGVEDADSPINEAIYHVDLSGATQATLSFSHIQFFEENHELPTEFMGHADGDGVAISDDGIRWRTILSNPRNEVWTTSTIDLAAAALAAGMKLGANFQIKFQQYDNYDYPEDGRAYDNIQITLPEAQDTYRFTLTAGESASIALKTLSGGLASFQLLDSSGTVLVSGRDGPTNTDRALANFEARSDGIYYLIVTGPTGAAYSAVVTRNSEFDSELNDTLSEGQPLLVAHAGEDQWSLGHVGNSGDVADLYEVSLAAGATLTVQTSTPDSGLDEPAGRLDPRLRIFAADGKLVAADENGAGDGTHALLSYINTGSAGTFYVEVAPTSLGNATRGEYALRIRGNSLAKPVFQVTSANPPSGATLLVPSPTFVLDFNSTYRPASVEAADLLIDGIPSATSVTLIDGNTVSFSLPALVPGLHTLSLAAGAIVDSQGMPLSAFSATLSNGAAPRVVATSPPPGGVARPGSLRYQVTFDTPMNAANLSLDDFLLQGSVEGATYSPISFFYDSAALVLTLDYVNLPEDNYTLTFLSGASGGVNLTGAGASALDGEFGGTFPSGNGTAGGNFIVGFTLDIESAAIPTPLTPIRPIGSLVHEGIVAGTIGPVGDADSFTLLIGAGHTFSVLLAPAAGLQATVLVRDPAGIVVESATAAAPGNKVLLQSQPALQSGTYTITVSGASGSLGTYTASLTLNAALESESHGGAANDSHASAQNIEIATPTSAPGASRSAVLGVTDATADRADYYALALETGEVVALALTGLGSGHLNLELRDGDAIVASGTAGPTNVTKVVASFTVPAAGTYYVRVSGDAHVPYNLLVAQNAALDAEGNDSSATAVSIDGVSTAFGAVRGIATTTVRLDTIQSGTWDSNGDGSLGFVSQSYLVGLSTTKERRNFFVFDLSSVTEPIVGASLVIGNHRTGYRSSDATETYTLFDVATPIDVLRRGYDNGHPEIFNDLGTGQPFGSQTVSVSDNNKSVTVALNASGLAALRAARRGEFALGGALTTLGGASTQLMFSGADAEFSRQLVLALAPDEDWYSLNVSDTSNRISLTTSTPGDSPDQFLNLLDPHIELYDPSNNLVASGAALADGRNEALSHLPLAAGIYRVRVTSDGGTTGEYRLNKSIATLPLGELTVTPVLQESEIAVLEGTFSNADPLAAHTVRIDWGPNQEPTTLHLPAGLTSFSAEHHYADDLPPLATTEVYAIHVTVTSDVSGALGVASTSVAVTNTPPSDLSLPPATIILENGVYTLSGTFHDLGSLDTHTVFINWGGGLFGQTAEGTTTITTSGPNPAGASLSHLGGGRWQFTATHKYLDDNPTLTGPDSYVINVSVLDDDLQSARGSTTVTVDNVSPLISTFPSIHTINEGDVFTLTGIFYDAGSLDTHTVHIDWEDSQSHTVITTTGENPPGASISSLGDGRWQFVARHQFLEDTSTSIPFANLAAIVDDDLGLKLQNFQVVVNNLPPTIHELTGLSQNNLFTLTGVFHDAGTLDTHTIVIDWEGGQSGEGVTTLTTDGPNPPGTELVYRGDGLWQFTASHPFAGNGPAGTPSGAHLVRVSISDDDEGTTNSNTTFVSTAEDVPLAITLGATEISADALSYRLVTQPLHGTLSGNLPNLTFRPDGDFSGNDRFIYATAGGLSDGDLLTVSINIRPVNDAPRFEGSTDFHATDESGPQSVVWASGISAGPADESEQALTFLVSVDNPALFAAGPTIDSAGRLTFTPAPNAHGVGIVSVRLRDGGGTSSGGIDVSALDTFTITIRKLHLRHNVAQPLDVTGAGGQPDGHIAPEDALAIINYINAFDGGVIPFPASPGPPYFDTTGGPDGGGDDWIAPNDVLAVINYINAMKSSRPPGEGEASGTQAPGGPSSSDLLSLLALDVAAQPKRRRI